MPLLRLRFIRRELTPAGSAKCTAVTNLDNDIVRVYGLTTHRFTRVRKDIPFAREGG